MPQAQVQIDDPCEFAVSFLLSRQGDAKRLAVTLARQVPTLSALELIFVLSSAAAGIEDVFAAPETVAVAMDGWRIAALLGVDLHMMQRRGLPNSTCGDLMSYWQTVDGFFLT